jgi:hypothetical protein
VAHKVTTLVAQTGMPYRDALLRTKQAAAHPQAAAASLAQGVAAPPFSFASPALSSRHQAPPPASQPPCPCWQLHPPPAHGHQGASSFAAVAAGPQGPTFVAGRPAGSQGPSAFAGIPAGPQGPSFPFAGVPAGPQGPSSSSAGATAGPQGPSISAGASAGPQGSSAATTLPVVLNNLMSSLLPNPSSTANPDSNGGSSAGYPDIRMVDFYRIAIFYDLLTRTLAASRLSNNKKNLLFTATRSLFNLSDADLLQIRLSNSSIPEAHKVGLGGQAGSSSAAR